MFEDRSPLYKRLYEEAKHLFETDYESAISKLLEEYNTYVNELKIQFLKFVGMFGPITDKDIEYGTITDPGLNAKPIHSFINHYVLYNDLVYFIFSTLIYSLSRFDPRYTMQRIVEDVLEEAKRQTMIIKNDFMYERAWVELNEDIFHSIIPFY
jgi:hypothetical protein